MTFFLHCLPFEVTVRIWDSIFTKNITSLLCVSLALIKIYKKKILTFDTEGFAEFLNELAKPNPLSNHPKLSNRLNPEALLNAAYSIRITD